MKEYYFVEKSPTKENFYVIHLDFELFGDKLQTTQGSYGVLAARILGLNYPDYVRLCINNYDAVAVGKNSLYTSLFFSSLAKANELKDVLNNRLKDILKF